MALDRRRVDDRRCWGLSRRGQFPNQLQSTRNPCSNLPIMSNVRPRPVLVAAGVPIDGRPNANGFDNRV
jgi:hypothetical protein